jgi:protein-S-isoprenylcysteine O-methyltransferase Ste14
VLLPAWVLMWLIVAITTARWHRVSLYETRWTWIPAIALFGLGIWLYTRAGKNFSAKQLGGIPEVLSGQHEQKLVTSGIREQVRHPVYVAHLCELLAWSVGTGLLVCYGLTAFAILTGGVMIRMEDRELEQRFGTEYAAYKKRVPAVWPRMRIRRMRIPS